MKGLEIPMVDTDTKGSAEAGAAIYNRRILSIYDLGVIKLSNQIAWRCPSRLILEFYNQHVSGNHLDVGVGTGYFLDKCRFPSARPRIALFDLNPNTLAVTAKRLRRYRPSTFLGDVLQPLQPDLPTFDSIGLNYLLHCLPGSMHSKRIVFGNLKPLLNENGVVFGTTILGRGVRANPLARRLMKLYNAKGIFSNSEDNIQDLESILSQHFREYSTRIVGCVAFFSASQ